MASKGKERTHLKNHEVEFNNKRIDLKRFAYDVMKYSALKFRVPESCIAVWVGSANDYGHEDFFLVVCRQIIMCQLAKRYRYHTFFRQHYKRNKLATPKLIGSLLQEVIQEEMERIQMTPLVNVGISLAVLCDLFLFLYSKDINLCPKQLATHWFQSYLNINKKKFEKAGGFKQMYLNGTKKKFDDVDSFISKFIEDNCLTYKTTADNPAITQLFIQSYQKRLPKSAKSLSENDGKEIEETVKSLTEMIKRQHSDIELEEMVVVPLPAPDEASSTNVPQNIDFEIIPHDKLFQLVGPLVASSQDPSAASPEGKPRHRRSLSYKKRMKKEIEDSGDDLLSNPGLGVPLPHEMYDFPFSVDEAQSQKLPVENIPELSKHTKGSSPRERSGKRSSRASVEQGLGQPSSDSSETKKPIVTRTVASPTSPFASSPEQPQHHETLSYKQRMKMMKSSLRPNVEQGLGQLSSDAYEMKQSSRKTPSLPRTLVPSQDPSATSPEEQPRRPRTLPDEEILKILSISGDESPLTSKREETLGVHLPSNPGLSVPLFHKMYNFLLADAAELSENLAEQSVQELSKHARSSHRERRNGKPSLRASVDQGLAQPSSDSSEAKKPIVTRTVASPQDPSAASPEGKPRHRRSLSCKKKMKKEIEGSGDDLLSNPGLGVPLPHEMYDFPFSVDEAQSQKLLEENIPELSKLTKGSSHRERSGKPSLRASVDKGLAQPSSDSSEVKKPIVTRTVASPKEPSATSPEEQPRRPRVEDEEIAKILSICEEESLTDEEILKKLSISKCLLTSKRGETLEVDLPSNLGLGVPLPYEIYNFPFSVDAAQTQKLPEEKVQEQSKNTKGSSYREKSRKPSSRASVEQGREQPSSDSSETKKPFVTRTVTSSKGPSASSPEQPQHHTPFSYKQGMKMVKSGLGANVEHDLGQPSSDSYEIKQSSKKTPSVPRALVPSQDPSATRPEEQLRRPRNLTDEHIAKILRNLTDEEIARLLSIPEEESLTSKRDETSEVDLPSSPGLGVPIPQEMYDFPLVDVAELSQKLPEEHGQETSKHARRLSRQERRDRKPSLRTTVELGLDQPRSDSSETKRPIVTRTIVSPKGPSASSPEEPQHHTTLSDVLRSKMIKSGIIARDEPGLGQSSSDSAIATETTQSYEHLGAKPKIKVEHTGSSGLQKIKSRGERKEETKEE